MQFWIRLLLPVLALAASDGLRAQACGTLLVSSVTLTRDMDCRGYAYAFKAIRDGVVVSLNGKTILGDAYGDGVVASGMGGVTVRGPGRLQAMRRAVVGRATEGLKVSRLDILGASQGVELISSRNARIEYVRFSGNRTAIEIRQPAAAKGTYAGGHTIYSNSFSTGFRDLRICGADAGDNLITGNSFERSDVFSIELSHEASRNRIQNNKFRSGTTLGMRSTNGNLVTGNVFENALGILILPEPAFEDCFVRTDDAIASGNQILNNHFTDLGSIQAGNPEADTPGVAVIANRIGYNRIERARIAIILHENTYDNDATGNTFVDVRIPVVDYGVGNTY